MGQHKLTFDQICSRAEKKNSESLMKKATLANRLAKRSRGTQRQTAYKRQSECPGFARPPNARPR